MRRCKWKKNENKTENREPVFFGRLVTKTLGILRCGGNSRINQTRIYRYSTANAIKSKSAGGNHIFNSIYPR